MHIADIEAALASVAESKFSRDSFIYDFIKSFDAPKATVAKLQQGHANKADRTGDVLWQNNLFFRPAPPDRLGQTFDDMRTDPLVGRWKPRFLLTTDGKDVRAADLKTDDIRDIAFTGLGRGFDFFLPLAGMDKFQVLKENPADVKATSRIARLYDEILATNPAWSGAKRAHTLNQILTRLLFCFFAEDTSIFSKKLFTQTLMSITKDDGSDIAAFLTSTFRVMNIPELARTKLPDWLARFPFVNGGLFSDDLEVPKFSAKARRLVKDCGELEWSEINPDIFGSMIQSVVDNSLRGNLGMHYTSVPNIMKVLRPLFLDELEEEFGKSKNDPVKLGNLLSRIRRIRVFDPACGSGNFLIIAYKELRKLETRIIVRQKEMSRQFALPMSEIRLDQFYGIEYVDFAAETARLSLWIAKHQMDENFRAVFGHAPPALPLKETGKIVHGNATRVDWMKVCPKDGRHETYIVGNPPYHGRMQQSDEQKADMLHVFGAIGATYKKLDYVACWILKAAEFCEKNAASAALLTTNSICQGEQVPLLWPHILKGSLEIGFAHLSFKWTNNAAKKAGVSCIVVGLRPTNSKLKKILFDDGIARPVDNINAYLVDADDIYVRPVSNAKSKYPKMDFGNMPNDGGNLLLTREEKKQLLSEHPEAKPFIKRIYGSKELIHDLERYCLWIEDDELNQAMKIKPIATRVGKVRKLRLDSTRETTADLADKPHRFGEVRQPRKLRHYILIPRVSSENRDVLPCEIVGPNVIPSDRTFMIIDGPMWAFSMIVSRMHYVWTDVVGGKIKTDFSYSNTIVYNTFPMPELTDDQKKTLADRAAEVIAAREKHPGKTLAWLYDPDTMPVGLKTAHKNLDDSFETMYLGRPFRHDNERLKHLFRLYTAAHKGGDKGGIPNKRAFR